MKCIVSIILLFRHIAATLRKCIYFWFQHIPKGALKFKDCSLYSRRYKFSLAVFRFAPRYALKNSMQVQ